MRLSGTDRPEKLTKAMERLLKRHGLQGRVHTVGYFAAGRLLCMHLTIADKSFEGMLTFDVDPEDPVVW